MSQVDEGLIHAWLDGQLSPDEGARVERLVATDAAWGAAAAEARGVVAGASRILGALDDVPSVRTVGGTGGAPRGHRSVWREPWLRAAAVLVLVVGVGRVVIQQWPSDKGIIESKEQAKVTDSVGRTQPQGVQNSITQPGVPAPPKNETRVDALRGSGAAAGAASAGAGAPPSIGGASTGAVTRLPVVIDSLKLNAPVLQKPAPLVSSGDAGRAGVVVGGGGRGGRAGALGGRSLDVSAEMRQLAAKSLADAQIIDPRVSGCWMAVDSAPGSASVLKFIDPIATDMQRRADAAPPAGRSLTAPSVPPRVLPRAPAGAHVENSSPRMFSADSSFTAEWVTGNGRTNLIFTVHGDTLTGQTHLSAGDVMYPGVPFRAVRVQCPQ